MSVSEETRRSNKIRIPHIMRNVAFVIATDGKGEVGLGNEMERVQKNVIEKATTQAKSEIFDFNLGSFDPRMNEKHTLTHQVQGKYERSQSDSCSKGNWTGVFLE